VARGIATVVGSIPASPAGARAVNAAVTAMDGAPRGAAVMGVIVTVVGVATATAGIRIGARRGIGMSAPAQRSRR
jgi:hypothetical protein